MTHIGYTAATLMLEAAGAVNVQVDVDNCCLVYSSNDKSFVSIELDDNNDIALKELEQHVVKLFRKTIH
jgi:hypothetical protein